MMNWVMARLTERSTWDGVVLVTCGAAVIIMGPLAKVAAYVAIGYGAWTIWKSEDN